MALFKSKKAPAAKAAEVKEEKKGAVTAVGARSLAHVLRHARITEKATAVQGMNVYTFDVTVAATKRDIAKAVQSLYKVLPRKVAIVTIPAKKRRNARTGRGGVTSAGKKAYVYLKSGDTISIS